MMNRLSQPAMLCTLVLAIATSACTTNPQTGQTEINKAALYGIGGAVTCGLIGAATHGSVGARNSALACGAIGAGVGAYMDNQEQKLREKLANTRIGVERVGNQIKLSLPDNVTFATNSFQLGSAAQQPLSDIAAVLVQYANTSITVAGHTDSTGPAAYNQTLSEKRAQAVTDLLATKGVNTVRIRTMGFGPSQPIASNATVEGRSKNRRVEVLIAPDQAAQ